MTPDAPSPPATSAAHAIPSSAVSSRRRDRILLLAATLLVTAAAIVVALDPGGLGIPVFVATMSLAYLAIVVGPLLRRVGPRRVWWPETAAGLCFLAGPPLQATNRFIGPFGLLDVADLTGFALLIVWLVLLTRHVGGGTAAETLLDTAAAVLGLALALWCSVLAPLVGSPHLEEALVWAAYPTIDGVLLALAVHLAIRLRRVVPSLVWLIPALTLHLALDVTTSMLQFSATPYDENGVVAGYLFSVGGVAVAACHPSVRLLSESAPMRPPVRTTVRVAVLLVLGLVPAIQATAVPDRNGLDVAVRTVLVALLLGAVFVRLASTMMSVAAAETRSHHRATHDALTGLLNRAALFDALPRFRAAAARRGASTAVLFLDCDEFKHVNDTWGHHAGDVLLQAVAARLRAGVREGDLVARNGGDEFVVVAAVVTPADALALGDRLRHDLAEPVEVTPGLLHVSTASVGIAVVEPTEWFDIDDVIARADLAMYVAKARGRGRCVLHEGDLDDADPARRPWGAGAPHRRDAGSPEPDGP